MDLPAPAQDVQTSIFSWIAPRLRQLPWRDIRDPWPIFVSEIMLQQTSVHRVVSKWEAFIQEFPTVRSCAEAELADILRLWQGLGYPRRARNLHHAARMIESDFAGRIPDTVEDLLTLPGVGPYTARAIVAFAFEGDAAVVDTNVARVLRRFTGQVLTPRSAQDLADALLPEGEAWLWNQALMDLGATVCRPKPVCDDCPLQSGCRWRGAGPDPAESSASSRQGRFEGSDRQARGRLMKALVTADLGIESIAEVMGRSPQIARDLTEALLDEGLIRRTGDRLHL